LSGASGRKKLLRPHDFPGCHPRAITTIQVLDPLTYAMRCAVSTCHVHGRCVRAPTPTMPPSPSSRLAVAPPCVSVTVVTGFVCHAPLGGGGRGGSRGTTAPLLEVAVRIRLRLQPLLSAYDRIWPSCTAIVAEVAAGGGSRSDPLNRRHPAT
jgi:hypothetical protein